MVDYWGMRAFDGGRVGTIARGGQLSVELRQALNGAPEQGQPYDRDGCDAGSLRSHKENGSGGACERLRSGAATTLAVGARATAARTSEGGARQRRSSSRLRRHGNRPNQRSDRPPPRRRNAAAPPANAAVTWRRFFRVATCEPSRW